MQLLHNDMCFNVHHVLWICMRLCNESLAVAEMDDPFATIDMGRNVGGGRLLCPFPRLELGPQLTHCCLGREAYLHTKWHLDPSNLLATIHQHNR